MWCCAPSPPHCGDLLWGGASSSATARSRRAPHFAPKVVSDRNEIHYRQFGLEKFRGENALYLESAGFVAAKLNALMEIARRGQHPDISGMAVRWRARRQGVA